MINNDVLRSLRYMLDLSDGHIVTLCQMADPTFAITAEEVNGFLRKEDEAGFVTCPDPVLARALDGLVIHMRGVDERNPAPPPLPSRMTNNLVLKKLRVAFQLRDEDMHAVFTAAGMPVSKPELSALFRQPAHKNYRACGDQLLRNFLKGLTLRVRG